MVRCTELTVSPPVYRLLGGPRGLAQRTDAWIRAREKLITASEVASAIGQNKYQSTRAYVKQKAGHTPRFRGNAATRWGTLHEPTAQALYEQASGERIFEMGLVPHPTVPFLAGSPDGVTFSGRLVEVKCPPKRDIADGSVPPHYMPQIQLLLEILDLPVCDFVQYKPGQPLVVTPVPRQQGWLQQHLPLLQQVHQEILQLAATPKPLDISLVTDNSDNSDDTDDYCMHRMPCMIDEKKV